MPVVVGPSSGKPTGSGGAPRSSGVGSPGATAKIAVAVVLIVAAIAIGAVTYRNMQPQVTQTINLGTGTNPKAVWVRDHKAGKATDEAASDGGTDSSSGKIDPTH